MKQDANYTRRKNRTRTRIKSGHNLPRLSVNVSNQHVIAQIIDDDQGETLAYSTSRGADIDGSLEEKATWVGEDIAEKAQDADIKQVVFDRGAYRFHGRIKAVAEAARKAGMEF